MKLDLGPLPEIHPREQPTAAAERDLAAAIDAILTKHGLTTGEALRVVSGACQGWIAGLARRAIRAERHPGDPEKPGSTA